MPLIVMLVQEESDLVYNQSMSEYLNKNQIITELRIDRCSLPRKTFKPALFSSATNFFYPSLNFIIFFVSNIILWGTESSLVCTYLNTLTWRPRHMNTYIYLHIIVWLLRIQWWFLECSLYHFVLMFRLSSFHMCKIKSLAS